MSDKPGIPAWQRTTSPATPTGEHESAPEQQEEDSATPVAEEAMSAEDDGELPSPSLLEQASRFLDDATIRDAPREKKVAFLQSKKVASEDIERLLGPAADGSASPVVEEAGDQASSLVSDTLCSLAC